jgi:hypothetical protein
MKLVLSSVYKIEINKPYSTHKKFHAELKAYPPTAQTSSLTTLCLTIKSNLPYLLTFLVYVQMFIV